MPMLKMRRTRPSRCRRRGNAMAPEDSLNTTIDLTMDDNVSLVAPLSRITSSSTWEVIDLSAEPDSELYPDLEIEQPSVQTSTQDQQARKNDGGDGDDEDDEDDLPVPPKMPVFDDPKPQLTCPICFLELLKVETVMTTKCGHMFCKNCIINSLNIKNVCPICRKKIVKSQLIVVYLHAT